MTESSDTLFVIQYNQQTHDIMVLWTRDVYNE